MKNELLKKACERFESTLVDEIEAFVKTALGPPQQFGAIPPTSQGLWGKPAAVAPAAPAPAYSAENPWVSKASGKKFDAEMPTFKDEKERAPWIQQHALPDQQPVVKKDTSLAPQSETLGGIVMDPSKSQKPDPYRPAPLSMGSARGTP